MTVDVQDAIAPLAAERDALAEPVAWLAGRTAIVSGLAAGRRPHRYRPAAP